MIHLRRDDKKTLCGRKAGVFTTVHAGSADCPRCLTIWRNRQIKLHAAEGLAGAAVAAAVAATWAPGRESDLRQAQALGAATHHLERLAYLTGVAEPIDSWERYELGLQGGIDDWGGRIASVRDERFAALLSGAKAAS